MRLTVDDVRAWPLVGGWYVEPRTGHRVRRGDGLALGDGADVGEGVSLPADAIVPDGATVGG